MFETLIYVVSISFQVSGAIMLLFCFFGKGKESEILNLNYYGEIRWHDMGEPMDRKIAIQKLEGIHCARISFVFIIIGYILGVFGNIAIDCKIAVVVGIVLGTAVLVGIAQLIAHLISCVRYDKVYIKQIN